MCLPDTAGQFSDAFELTVVDLLLLIDHVTVAAESAPMIRTRMSRFLMVPVDIYISNLECFVSHLEHRPKYAVESDVIWTR